MHDREPMPPCGICGNPAGVCRHCDLELASQAREPLFDVAADVSPHLRPHVTLMMEEFYAFRRRSAPAPIGAMPSGRPDRPRR
jgi:hypothetical protein